ncbi:hypothetical protein [Streptomyces sp. WM6378]|uniref:hypothetical protein n=1 Tax=Streptomyces sp. WM6378 TaxID=1415557 RepID=UPI0006AE1537|nr:hypothetical protein [Streptomyces sp. WM6378]KOU52609.1 hypothetical protein ADK54_06970 [Streptomyces sp. WM6378]
MWSRTRPRYPGADGAGPRGQALPRPRTTVVRQELRARLGFAGVTVIDALNTGRLDPARFNVAVNRTTVPGATLH